MLAKRGEGGKGKTQRERKKKKNCGGLTYRESHNSSITYILFVLIRDGGPQRRPGLGETFCASMYIKFPVRVIVRKRIFKTGSDFFLLHTLHGSVPSHRPVDKYCG